MKSTVDNPMLERLYTRMSMNNGASLNLMALMCVTLCILITPVIEHLVDHLDYSPHLIPSPLELVQSPLSVLNFENKLLPWWAQGIMIN